MAPVFNGLLRARSAAWPALSRILPDMPGTWEPRNWSRSFLASNICYLRVDDDREIGSGDRNYKSVCAGFMPSGPRPRWQAGRSEEHTSELQSLMRISYAVFCLKKKKTKCREQ